jgi:hypothetical protein
MSSKTRPEQERRMPTVDLDTKLPNNMMRFILTQFDDTMGPNGTKSVLNYSGLGRLIDNYPPDDFAPGEPVMTFFTLVKSLLEIYGENGYRALVRGVGEKSFQEMKTALPWLFEVEGVSLDDLHPTERFGVILKSYSEKLSRLFGETGHIETFPDRIVDTAHECIWCIGLSSRGPICVFTEDFYTAMGIWAGAPSVKVVETGCRAAGAEACVFLITFG